MKWIDMHCDTLSEIIRQRKELKTNDLCADLERLLRGGAGAQFFACFVNAARYGLNTKDADEKMIWDQAYWNVLSMIGRAKREQNERFEIAVEPEMIQRMSPKSFTVYLQWKKAVCSMAEWNGLESCMTEESG